MRRFSLSSRLSTGLLIALSLLASGTVLALGSGVHYWDHYWVASDHSEPHLVIGLSTEQSCSTFSSGSVCAEFVSPAGVVNRMCCVSPEALGQSDPDLCLADATYSREGRAIE
ncbi:MAG: hypothetical protein AAGE94_07105 [Acidobacteriota bacterium]